VSERSAVVHPPNRTRVLTQSSASRPGVVTMPCNEAAKLPFPTCSAVRGIDSLERAEVVADRPVLG